MRNDIKLNREVAGKKQLERISAHMLCDSDSVVGAARDEVGPTVTSSLLQFGARYGDINKTRPAG
jgi:hypothetical protein